MSTDKNNKQLDLFSTKEQIGRKPKASTETEILINDMDLSNLLPPEYQEKPKDSGSLSNNSSTHQK